MNNYSHMKNIEQDFDPIHQFRIGPFVIHNCHKNYLLVLCVIIPLEILVSILYYVYFAVQEIKTWEYATKPIPLFLIVILTIFVGIIYTWDKLRIFILIGFLLSLGGIKLA
jgi:hypothetical protein